MFFQLRRGRKTRRGEKGAQEAGMGGGEAGDGRCLLFSIHNCIIKCENEMFKQVILLMNNIG